MKKISTDQKTKTPTNEQVNEVYIAIKKFQENNTKYLMVSGSNVLKTPVMKNIFTTNNTNI